MCIHCSTQLKGNEYWWKMYRVSVHTHCVSLLSDEAFDRDFLSTLPRWIQETASGMRDRVQSKVGGAMQVSEF